MEKLRSRLRWGGSLSPMLRCSANAMNDAIGPRCQSLKLCAVCYEKKNEEPQMVLSACPQLPSLCQASPPPPRRIFFS
eukprot:763447-Hanusia_phi.AAC.1